MTSANVSTRHLLVCAMLAVTLASCSGEPSDPAAQSNLGSEPSQGSEPMADSEQMQEAMQQEGAEQVQAGMEAEAAEQGQPADAAESEAQPSVEDRGFDLSTVPVSSAALGEFPYFSMPEGYEAVDSKTQDFGQAAFWTGDRHEVVEGRTYTTGIRVDKKSGKTFSALEVRRNIEHLMTSAGGVKVFSGELPNKAQASEEAKDAIRQHGYMAVCQYGTAQIQTYVLRRQDGLTWVRACATNGGSGLIVVDAESFKPTAKLLPASELKQQLDSTGKVALQVNFATDKTEILPESAPQIEQVTKLLKDDPSLKLAVNGHTDNTGDSAHNQALSQGRAKSVVAAITAKGIDGSRLTAKGYGDTRPVADNATEEGKASNRRVELVKR